MHSYITVVTMVTVVMVICLCVSQEDKHWRSITLYSAGWVDCVRAPIVALSITYTYWPVSPQTYRPEL